MIATEEIQAAVIAAHGRESASVLAERHALTRNQVIGIWHRRPRDTPEEKARLGMLADIEALPPEPFTPESAPVTGRPGAAWACMVAAGSLGATRDAMVAAMYGGGPAPSTQFTFHDAIRRLRSMAERNGYTVAVVTGARPTRWRIQPVGGDPEPVAAAAPAAAPVAPISIAPVPSLAAATESVAPVWPTARAEAAAPTGLTGAAAAVAALRRGCCKWPIGEPTSPAFRFCCEAIQNEGKPYCPDHRREASAGMWSARRAA